MGIEKEYISVSQYAEAKGISKQAVYKQLNNKLKPFLKVVDGKKCLDISVLTEVEQPKVNQVEQPFNQVEQPLNNQVESLFAKQIEEKDKTIQSLLRQVENLQEQNGRLTELLHNSQYLLAAEQKKFIEPPQPQETETTETETKKGFFARLKQKRNKS
jgi:DNA-binding protein Fis